MARPKKQKFEVTRSSGNVYADFGVEDAEEMLIKAKLSILLAMVIDKRGLTQKEAAKIIGIDQPKLSKIINGRFRHISIERLMRYLKLLGIDVWTGLQNNLDKLAKDVSKASSLKIAA